MNAACEHCGRPIEGEPPVSNRQGDFCGARCYTQFLLELPDPRPFAPAIPDEASPWDPDDPPFLPAFCHP